MNLFFAALCCLLLCGNHKTRASELIPQNCIGLEDGTYSLQLIDDDDYPSVTVKCNNEYIVLDYKFDKLILKYFSSSQETTGAFSPINSDRRTWREWYLPDGGSNLHNYIVSPDCNSCETDNKNLQIYGTMTTYWVSGVIEKAAEDSKNVVFTSHDCDMNATTLDCYYCKTVENENKNKNDLLYIGLITDQSTEEMYSLTGYCTHKLEKSDFAVCQTQECVVSTREIEYHVLPSLGNRGKYCVCVQPSDQEIKYAGKREWQVDNNDDYDVDDDVDHDVGDDQTSTVKLYNKDFKHGTYRITKPGVYQIMEDIEFDFNKDYDYWPLESQSDEYNGADSSYRDEYCMGFFAGISIECDNVIIDLNNHQLSMSFEFFHFQRWFTIIELSKQYFMPDSGIAYFGGNPSYSKNIEIKNGILGLSSHQAIHGNMNKNVKISNLKINNFLTHGIQLNGFENVEISNVEIGPAATNSYFKPAWSSARISQRIWQRLADKTIDQTVTFNKFSQRSVKSNGLGATVSMQDLVDELTDKMQIAWQYVLYMNSNIKHNIIDHDEDQHSTHTTKNTFIDDYISQGYSKDVINEAIDLFINPTGINDGSAQYGIYLNKLGASVFVYNYDNDLKIGDRDVSSKGLILKDITIHGLKHRMRESSYFRVVTDRDENTGSLHYDLVASAVTALLSPKEMFNEYPTFSNGFPSYKGNIITDGYVASAILARDNTLGFEVGFMAQAVFRDIIGDWATINNGTGRTNTHTQAQAMNDIIFGCNTDEVIHSGKGIIGIRLDSINDVTIDNVNIYDLHDYTPLGSTFCQDYNQTIENNDGFRYHTQGHLTYRLAAPQMIGFSGNMNQAIAISGCKNVLIQDITISDITSDTGSVYGVAIWPGTQATLKGNNSISNLKSGDGVQLNTFDFNQIPNGAPETCAIRLYSQFQSFTSSLTCNSNETQLVQKCLFGHVGCFGQAEVWSSVGKVQTTPDGNTQDVCTVLVRPEQDIYAVLMHQQHQPTVSFDFYVQMLYVLVVCSVICCLRYLKRCLSHEKY